MSDPILWRLIWKEYREQRRLWLALLALAAVVEAGLFWYVSGNPALASATRARVLLALAWIAPVFFALGAGAISYAAEREAGTDELLRALATPWARWLAAKLSVALAAAAAMLVVCLAAGVVACLFAEVPVATLAEQFGIFANWFPFWVTAALAFLLLAVICSLLIPDVLYAACVAAVLVAGFIGYSTTLPLSPFFPAAMHYRRVHEELASVSLWLCLLDLVLLAAVVSLTRLKLAGVGWRPSVAVPGWPLRRRLAMREALARRLADRPVLRAYCVLVSRELGPALRTVSLVFAAELLLLVVLAATSGFERHVLPGVWFWALFVPGLSCGVFAFRSEQRRWRYRFLADQGLEPGRVWLSKHAVWLAAAGLLSAAVLLAAAALGTVAAEHTSRVRQARWRYLPATFAVVLADHWERVTPVPYGFVPLIDDLIDPDEPQLADPLANPLNRAIAAILALLAYYAAGQLASMLLPRAIIAAAVAVVLGLAMTLWQTLLVLSFGVAGAALLPFALVLIAATWVRCRDWLTERNTFAAWCKFAGALVLPSALFVCLIAAGRVWSVPSAPEVPVARLRRIPSEAIDTLLSYTEPSVRVPLRRSERRPRHQLLQGVPERDWARWIPIEEEMRRWVKENARVLPALIELTKRPNCAMIKPSTSPLRQLSYGIGMETVRLLNVGTFLIMSARQIETDEGDLRAAFDCYMAALRVARHMSQNGGTTGFVAGRLLAGVAYYWLARWGAHPRQSPELLEMAITELERFRPTLPGPTDAADLQYALTWEARRWVYSLLPQAGLLGVLQLGPRVWPPGAWLLLSLPWERARERRLIRALWFAEHEYLKAYEAKPAEGYTDILAWLGTQPVTTYAKQYYELLASAAAWRRAASRGYDRRLAQLDLLPLTLGPRAVLFADVLIYTDLDHEARYRALLLTLMLLHWRLEHGRLPQRLAELEQRWGQRVPLAEPWHGLPFGYMPRSLKERQFVTPLYWVYLAEKRRDAEAAQHCRTFLPVGPPPYPPLLWCGGPFDLQFGPVRVAGSEQPCFAFVDKRGRVAWVAGIMEYAVLRRWSDCLQCPESPWEALLGDRYLVGPDAASGILFPIPRVPR